MPDELRDFSVVVKEVKSGKVRLASECRLMLLFVAKQSDPAVLKECKAQAAAVMAYLSQRKDASVEEHNAAVTIRTRIEHRLGEVLKETVRHAGAIGKPGPGRGRKTGDIASPVLNGALPDEITRKQSSRSQQLARIPWKKIEQAIDKKTKNNEKASQSRVVKELLQEQQRTENQLLVENTKPLTAIPGVFQAIVVDPPWDWGDEGDVSQFGRGKHEYAGMSFDELLKFPLGDKADKNCHLYLWITNRSLPKGFALMEAWGFRYVTNLVWCKPSFGMGNYFRGAHELVLFGVKGSLSLLRKDVGTWFSADRQGKHSTKPDEFYRLVEECSPGPWLEVFSRKERHGWTQWGAEV